MGTRWKIAKMEELIVSLVVVVIAGLLWASLIWVEMGTRR
jgi:hypothetical protein